MSSGRVYFITFSTYGTRLLGREQGSYRWDSAYVEPQERLRRYMEENLNEPPVKFEYEERAFVHDQFMRCANRFGWEIDALNVREEHVHIVIFAPNGESSQEVVRKLKTSATRALYESERRIIGSRIWTKAYAETVVWSIGFWRRKVEYTLLEQGGNSYLRKSEFGRMWIKRIRAACGKETFTMQKIYGGEERASRRAAFFMKNADRASEQ